MEKPAVGSITMAVFPFSNLQGRKLRPTLVLAHGDHNDVIVCQITSKAYASSRAIRIAPADFADGALPVVSFIRPDKLFTTDRSLLVRTVGTMGDDAMTEVRNALRALFSGE
jgi:mRNA interferase MazF